MALPRSSTPLDRPRPQRRARSGLPYAAGERADLGGDRAAHRGRGERRPVPPGPTGERRGRLL